MPKTMNLFFTLIDVTVKPRVVTLITVDPTDIPPVSGLPQAVPVSGSNHLGEITILVVLAGMVGVAAQAASLILKGIDLHR